MPAEEPLVLGVWTFDEIVPAEESLVLGVWTFDETVPAEEPLVPGVSVTSTWKKHYILNDFAAQKMGGGV